MSIVLNGTTQYATGERSFDPTGSFQVIMWHRLDADYGTARIFCASGNNGNFVAGAFEAQANDTWRGQHRNGNTLPSADTLDTTGATWHAILIEYEGETTSGVSGDGTLTVKVMDEGGSDWVETESIGSLSDQTAENYVIGNTRPDGAGTFVEGAYAMLKIHFGTLLSDAQVKTELQYRNPQETMWASHQFATGALATDDSGNGRDLTLTGTPTFSSDEPSNILGDDPAAGSALPQVNAMLLS